MAEAQAQQAPIPVIGYLSTGWASDGIPKFAAGFQQGLKETGLVEGRDYAIEYHLPGGQILPKAHFATVYAKPMGRPMVDTFITEVSQDTWIYFPWDLGLSFQPPIRNGAA